MQNKTFHCAHCNHTFERMVGDAILTAICPPCGKAARLVRLGMDAGLTFSEAVVGIVLGIAALKLLTRQ